MTALLRCAGPGCQASIPDHAWGHTKAAGWFLQKDGRAWCPEHQPGWLQGWRNRRLAKP